MLHVFSDTIKKADTTLKLLKIDPFNKDVHKSLESIDVETGTKLRVVTYKRSSSYKSGVLHNFYKRLVLFLSNLTAHMIEKCPLKHLVVRCSSCLNPNSLAIRDKNESSKLKFSKIVEKLASLNQISVKLSDDAKEEFSKFVN